MSLEATTVQESAHSVAVIRENAPAMAHFISGSLQIPQCCHSSSQFRPPGGLGDELPG
jgi:hypothetical protein